MKFNLVVVGALFSMVVAIGCSSDPASADPVAPGCPEEIVGSCDFGTFCMEYSAPASAANDLKAFCNQDPGRRTWSETPCSMADVVKGCDDGCGKWAATNTTTWYRASYPQPAGYETCSLKPRR